MPIIGPISKATSKTDFNRIIQIFSFYEVRQVCGDGVMVIMEDQIAMPKFRTKAGVQIGGNVSSTAKTFRDFGRLEGVIMTTKFPLTVVNSRVWQREMYMNEPDRSDKKVTSRIVAQRLWPYIDFKRSDKCKKLDDGMTDAALIAEYGRRKNL